MSELQRRIKIRSCTASAFHFYSAGRAIEARIQSQNGSERTSECSPLPATVQRSDAAVHFDRIVIVNLPVSAIYNSNRV